MGEISTIILVFALIPDVESDDTIILAMLRGDCKMVQLQNKEEDRELMPVQIGVEITV